MCLQVKMEVSKVCLNFFGDETEEVDCGLRFKGLKAKNAVGLMYLKLVKQPISY